MIGSGFVWEHFAYERSTLPSRCVMERIYNTLSLISLCFIYAYERSDGCETLYRIPREMMFKTDVSMNYIIRMRKNNFRYMVSELSRNGRNSKCRLKYFRALGEQLQLRIYICEIYFRTLVGCSLSSGSTTTART